MRFDTFQHMKMGQSMKLAPRMIQSMEILQMPLAELEERIEQELESNPTLEVVEPGQELLDGSAEARDAEDTRSGVDRDQPMEVDSTSGTDDFERLDSYEHANPEASENEFDAQDRSPPERSYDDLSEFSRRDTGGDRDAKMDAMAAAPARGLSLAEQLADQWSITDVDETLKPFGDLLITFLDDDGYLRTPIETVIDRAPRIADQPAPTVEQLTRALEAMQLFLEPAGVAARTPAECLRLQLDALEADLVDQHDEDWPRHTFAHARLLVEHHLDDLMQNRLPKVSEKTGLDIEQIRTALSLLKRLSLAPGRRLVSDSARPIIPDAIVEYEPDEDRYIAYLNDTRLPNLRINQEYARLTKDRGVEKKDKEFLRTNISNAQWLMDAVQQRKHTLLRVVNAVVAAQREYFDFGPQALKPLPMTGVAEQLGIHVATVSRAVADKHLATPRGTVPLRKFFSGGLQARGEDGAEGEDMAWDAIKAALKEIVDAEDKSKPLSDEALVEELKKRGIDIARRTVAKYRDQLQLPAARLRKRH